MCMDNHQNPFSSCGQQCCFPRKDTN
jgi:hypothetical protein